MVVLGVCFCCIRRCFRKRRSKDGKKGMKGVDLKSVQLLGSAYKEKVMFYTDFSPIICITRLSLVWKHRKLTVYDFKIETMSAATLDDKHNQQFLFCIISIGNSFPARKPRRIEVLEGKQRNNTDLSVALVNKPSET